MADAHNVKEPPSQFKLNLSKQAWHGYDLDELIAYTRAQNIKRIHLATTKTGQAQEQEKRAG